MGKNNNRWTNEEIEWGKRLASERGVSSDWDEPSDDEDDIDASIEEVWKYQMGRAYDVDDLSQLFDGAHPSDLAAFSAGVERVSSDLTGLSFQELQRKLYEAPPYDIDGEILSLQMVIDARGIEVVDLRGTARGIRVPEHSDLTQIEAIESARNAVLSALDALPVSAQSVIDAKALMTILTDIEEQVIDEIAALIEQLRKIVSEAEKITEVGHLKDQIERLTKARQDLSEAVGKPPQKENVEAAQRALDTLGEKADEVNLEIAEYGDSDKIDELCLAFGTQLDNFADTEEKFGGRKQLQAVAKVFSASELTTLISALSVEDLADAVAAFGSPAALSKAMKDLGGADKLSALLSHSEMDGPGAKTLLDNLGGGFVGELMGNGSDPTNAIEIQKKLGSNADTFKSLLKDGGLGTKPKALLAMFEQGCAGDAKTFVDFCNSFDDDTKRENLAGLIDTGGLGDAPATLGALVKDGFGGNPEGLQAMGAAFTDTSAREGLGRMLGAGGLDGTTPGIKADTLAMMMKHGAGPRPGTATDAEEKRQAEALAQLAKGMNDTACTDLKATLDAGGLGNDPEVFGHLLGTGCEGSDPTKLNALTAELQKDPANQQALKDMLQKGGFGTLDDGDIATNVKPECLAFLLLPGCEGKPDEIVKLLIEFDDTSRAAMKGVMSAGELGRNPKVIGQLYKQGCLADPNGAHDADKNPTVLTDMVGEFADSTGPALFKNMLSDSGFAEAGKEDRLASVMQHAFTPPRGGNIGKQQAKNLRKMANSFGTPNNEFAKLKTTMEAFETADDHVLEESQPNAPNQPGKGLKNVVHATRFNGDPSAIKAEFYDKLDTRSTAPSSLVEASPSWVANSPPRMGMTALLQTAASFEHEPIGPANVPVNCGAAGVIDMDMEHAAGRHTRKHCEFIMNSSPQYGTTLYPRTVDTAALKTKVEETVVNGLHYDSAQPPANRKNAAPPPAGVRRTPPVDDFDYYGNFCSTAGTDNSGMNNRIGFSKTGAPPYSVGQVFPKPPHAELVSVNNNDMKTIENILTGSGALY